MSVTVYIALGSNIDAEANVEEALDLLTEHGGLLGVSRFYWTKAIGRPEQADFLNGATMMESNLSARALKHDVLRKIESTLGRIRVQDKFAPREIDLDILLYGDEIINTPDLRVPDPDLVERPFLASAILDLWPDAHLPTGPRVDKLFPQDAFAGLICNNEFSSRMKSRFLK